MLSSLSTATPPPLLHTSPLLFPFSSTHYHYCFPCPPPTTGPAPLLLHPLPVPLSITSSTVAPLLLSHRCSPCTTHLHRHFASTSHPSPHPPLFLFPSSQDQRSPLSSTYHRSCSVSPSLTATSAPHYLIHCRSLLSSPTVVPPAPPISTATLPPPHIPSPRLSPFPVPSPQDHRSPLSSTHQQSRSLSLSLVATPPPHYLFHYHSLLSSPTTILVAPPISTATSPPPHIPWPHPLPFPFLSPQDQRSHGTDPTTLSSLTRAQQWLNLQI